MKRLALGLFLMASVAHARATEVLVTTTGTQLPKLSARTSVLIQNAGPNAICCADVPATQTTLSGNDCVEIAADQSLALNVGDTYSLMCRAATADQTAGNGTRVWELR